MRQIKTRILMGIYVKKETGKIYGEEARLTYHLQPEERFGNTSGAKESMKWRKAGRFPAGVRSQYP